MKNTTSRRSASGRRAARRRQRCSRTSRRPERRAAGALRRGTPRSGAHRADVRDRGARCRRAGRRRARRAACPRRPRSPPGVRQRPAAAEREVDAQAEIRAVSAAKRTSSRNASERNGCVVIPRLRHRARGGNRLNLDAADAAVLHVRSSRSRPVLVTAGPNHHHRIMIRALSGGESNPRPSAGETGRPALGRAESARAPASDEWCRSGAGPARRLAFMMAKLYNTSASRFQRETRGGPRRRAEEIHGHRLG